MRPGHWLLFVFHSLVHFEIIDIFSHEADLVHISTYYWGQIFSVTFTFVFHTSAFTLASSGNIGLSFPLTCQFHSI